MNVFAIARAEWLRCLAHPVYRWVVLLLCLLLGISALWSGLNVRSYRTEVVAEQARWEEIRKRAASSAARNIPITIAEGTKAAASAHALGRGDLGATRLPATGGLVLGLDQYYLLPTALRATIESRYSDGRVTGPLSNPLLADTGLPSFPSIVVLLLPLAALALTAGMVQEDRERGIWRLVCAQCNVGLGNLFAVALAIRWGAIFMVAAVASICAFLLDPGAGAVPLGVWLLGLAAFTAFWVLAGGLLSLLPVSAGAAMTGALGLWLALTFAVPGVLAWYAERHTPMPSRLGAIVELRAVQQDTEEREAELLDAWYKAHPQARPAANVLPRRQGWPVTFMPRFEEQELRMRAQMRRFDQIRAAQAAAMERYAWLSPSLALLFLADRLAGIDAARYSRYVDAVDQFENRWRAFFMPRIMAYRGVSADDMVSLPVFTGREAAQIDANSSDGPALQWLAAVCALLACLVVAARRTLHRP